MASANWTRGLLRLWIVLSGLWVAFIAAAVIADPCPVTMRVSAELWPGHPAPARPGPVPVGPEAANFLDACRSGSPVIDVIGPLSVFFGPIYG